jgi:hypothetical protein
MQENIRKPFPTYSFFVLMFLTVISCRGPKHAINTEPVATVETRTDFKSSKVLSERLVENEFTYQWLTSKFNAETNVDGKSTSFTVSVRAKKDSALWMSISPALGIEVARLLATQDSVKFIDRLNNKYFKGDYNYISQLLHTDLDFDMLQSLLLGNSVSFDHEEEKLKSMVDNQRYLLSTIRKRKLRKVLNENSDLKGKKDLIQSIWLEPETYKISRIYIEDFNTNRTFNAIYSDFKNVDSLSVPHKISFDVQAEKNMNIKIDYTKIMRIAEPQTFPFTIPAKYEKLR